MEHTARNSKSPALKQLRQPRAVKTQADYRYQVLVSKTPSGRRSHKSYNFVHLKGAMEKLAALRAKGYTASFWDCYSNPLSDLLRIGS